MSNITKLLHNKYFSYSIIFLINFWCVLYIQSISNIHFTGSFIDIILYKTYPYLVALDILCILLILFLPKILQRIIFTCNILICSFLYVYINVLNEPPSFTILYNGFKHIEGVPLYAYIPFHVILFLILAIFLIQYYISFLSKIKNSYKYVLVLSCSIILLQIFIVIDKPLRHTKMFFNFGSEIRRSINNRGFIATSIFEWYLELHKQADGAFPKEWHPLTQDINNIPTITVKGNIVLIQVESLGYEMLNTIENTIPVMPFLHSLQKNSIVLKVDGIKKLGSSNSDYEILTTRNAPKGFLAYEFVKDFSGNIIEKMNEKDYTTRMFVGVVGHYMNMRTAYSLMGFQDMHFSREMSEAEYTPLKEWAGGGIFSDRDLFDFIMTKNPKIEEKRFEFIITMSMHEPSYTKDNTEPFEKSKYPEYYKACYDTDNGIRAYYDTLNDGTIFIIYGDHMSYFGDATPHVPFIVHIKGDTFNYMDDTTIYTRTDMSHYLRKLFDVN